MNLELRFFSSLVYILQNLLMFNANGGYLTEPHQAHFSVACMYRHIHNSNRHLAHKICLIPQTIPETAISVLLQALHYLTKEICDQKTLRVETIKKGSFKKHAPWPQTARFQDQFFP